MNPPIHQSMAVSNTLFPGGVGGCSCTPTTTAHASSTYPPNYFLPKKNPTIHNPKPTTSSSSFKTRAAVGDGLMGGRKSFYELLGIPEEGTHEDVKKGYKQMARIYHPDVCPPDQTEEYTRRFIEVQEAYETLSDPSSKALYDRHLAARGAGFAFRARRKMQQQQGSYDGSNFPWISHQDLVDEKTNWKIRWQRQVAGLKNRSFYKDSSGSNLSWGARMRKQRDKSTNP